MALEATLPIDAIKDRLEPVIDELERRVERGVKRGRRALEDGRDAAEDARASALRQVRRHPARTLLLAAGIGAFAGVIVGAALMRCRD